MILNTAQAKALYDAMCAMPNNIQICNNTGSDIRAFDAVFADSYKTGTLPEDFADLFTITILKGYNPDGTDRMIIEAA